jgi:hypothetical protein
MQLRIAAKPELLLPGIFGWHAEKIFVQRML